MSARQARDHPAGSPKHLFGLSPATASSGSVLRDALQGDGYFASSVRALVDLVDGIDSLEGLSPDPWLGEAIDATELDGELRHRVREITAAIEGFGARFLFSETPDPEYRTIIARLVRRIVERSPVDLLRSTPQQTAAALVWLAMHGNDDLGRRGQLSASLIWQGFDVAASTDLGRRLHRAAGLRAVSARERDERVSATWLRDPALLHSRTRRGLIGRRDALVAAIQRHDADRRARAPLSVADDGRVAVRARPTVPRWVVRVPDDSGRDVVIVAIGNNEADVEVLAVSVPDAHRLIQLLHRALSSPRLAPSG